MLKDVCCFRGKREPKWGPVNKQNSSQLEHYPALLFFHLILILEDEGAAFEGPFQITEAIDHLMPSENPFFKEIFQKIGRTL